MNLTASTTEVIRMFNTLMEIDGITMPIEDTLNLKNGLNYSQFLEAILRIGYLRSERPEDFQGCPAGRSFKQTLEDMFSDAEIDVSKRQQRDPILIQVYNADCNDVFFVYVDVLSAIFSLRGLDRSNTYVELDKKEFMHVLDEAKLLIKPRQKTKEEEKKERETTKKGGAVEQKKVEEVPLVQETLFLEKDVERAIEGV